MSLRINIIVVIVYIPMDNINIFIKYILKIINIEN